MTDQSEKNTFMGVPIIGTIYSVEKADQRSEEEFAELVKALFAHDVIKEFGWRQYTPHFNDGEPCIFGAHGFWVRTVDEEDKPDARCPRCHTACAECDEDESDDSTYPLEIGTWSPHPTLGGYTRHNDTYRGNHESAFLASVALWQAIDGNEFDHVLLKLFGDGAQIIVGREKITVDEYDHG